MSFLKSLFRKKTKEELQQELQSLIEAQARDNEMIERWIKRFKESKVVNNDNDFLERMFEEEQEELDESISHPYYGIMWADVPGNMWYNDD